MNGNGEEQPQAGTLWEMLKRIQSQVIQQLDEAMEREYPGIGRLSKELAEEVAPMYQNLANTEGFTELHALLVCKRLLAGLSQFEPVEKAGKLVDMALYTLAASMIQTEGLTPWENRVELWREAREKRERSS